MSNVYVSDWGFILSFPSEFDLTVMSGVRMLIKRPKGSITYEFLPAEYNTVNIGGTLLYTVRETDLNRAGEYSFQVAAKIDGSLDLAFDPFVLTALDRASNLPWP